ncbi:threonine-phosphate decarboxylase [Bradyrhizobium sp. WBOS7]|uniref:threonine-phosphate decarboxylase n=2 Tax=Nitrobacteraceae TaxID=41294 RepID=A0AAE9NCA3_9BRAD|nr:threonine-phosphate decarboxylase [Bradyrhizobium sp. WBOS2]MDD1571829.1 threonine-phosphate decarboxylase [Bradyrhizobium sp. WBOS1]MDD1575333.1 threonine-phosphate decarboxylase [Bradyrhizobium sp. WBOS7]MDD1600796.1 threonine-phosphate decarboxylase [Bradyrhizobium sp. WBOS16]UUO36236.1 threonine-phosphate decarboxylase [Bradyrhizobium sp. WBOS01]UUO42541.1 threonine-phosphate decarboxylase [Bradyrhizobium sp. WBOS02]UUO56880.1 threonine-phosphate decarboxylase [Bradyrhizobium sp. WBOS0
MKERGMREHGGNLDQAQERFGGRAEDWIDLSTGINRSPYPVGELSARAWSALPSRAEIEALHRAAQHAYRTSAPIVALGGAQAVIQLLPQLAPPGRARILAPTYNEYAGVLSAAGWDVREAGELDALAGADLAIVVNPNNPDGRNHAPKDLLALPPRVGRLVIDESFVDAVPLLSLASEADRPGLLVLRSFGKFYGLAGLRLGFAVGNAADIAGLAELSGPWPVSGAAIAIGCRALRDDAWAEATSARLARDCVRLDEMARAQGWTLVGGTPLFRLYQTPDALAAQEKLAHGHIWSRVFAREPTWLRLGLPGSEAEWTRLAEVLAR